MIPKTGRVARFSILGVIVAFFATVLIQYISTAVFALSPSFPQQEIIDEIGKWIDLGTKVLSKAGDRYTDIVSVDYSSNGKTFNATLWLLFPFKVNPVRENVNYGMFIDADFNRMTGFGGIDYQVEIRWNNETKKWNEITESWSSYGETRVLDNESDYKGFYEKDGKYVLLSVKLDKILYPQKYKVIFYAETRKEGSYKTDFTRWVAVPPLELTVSTIPNSIDLVKGEQKTIEVRVNSTQGYEPTVNIYTINQSKDIKFNFIYNNLRIPSYGMSSTPLTINVSKDALTGPYTLFIFANSTFPPEELIKPKTEIAASDYRSSISTENIITQSSVLITVKEPPSLLDQIGSGWEKLGGPIFFLYGIIAGISPWLFGQIKKFVRKGKK